MAGESVVKSAARVLEVFEFFADERRPASVGEVAEALGYPQSSTSVLLKCLAALGYLSNDRESRRYAPTQRVALLGSWIEMDVRLQAILESLRNATGETIIVAQRSGIEVRYIHIVESQREVQLRLRTGTRRPLTRTATGLVLLAQMQDDEILRILRRQNALAASAQQRLSAEQLMAAVAEARDTGFAMTQGTMTEGAGVIATLLIPRPSQPALAVGVGAPLDRLLSSRRKIVAALKAVTTAAPARRPRRKS